MSEKDSAGAPTLGVDLSLAQLTAGDHVIDISAGSGAVATESSLRYGSCGNRGGMTGRAAQNLGRAVARQGAVMPMPLKNT
jgi:precorrin-6B methylase 2